ncbi:NAD(P)/FAD-dependent oxidoreductase [Jongsikchunia kroppenstedtii]|uniref:NAD(P)/FAD-dependent oxidoreductase n=1 Tax=Jongsikchunia kroppenstedtii TaxID=1121721 RepID=UPI0003682148|nr:NAD(P)/FAD-dependent oxidoreductase [Jongsikchunia kroppenstedtii]
MNDPYDVLVIGGGAAGLSATLLLARARLRVLLVDSGQQRNLPAAGVHGFVGNEGTSPADLVARGIAEVRGYGAEVIEGRVESLARDGDTFGARLADGTAVTARRVLVTTGLVDELPDHITGIAERWGRDVLHCPFCHGWEVRDQPIGIIATGAAALHQATLFTMWTDDLTLFTNDAVVPDESARELLAARGVTIVDGAVESLVIEDDRVTGIRLADGTIVPRTTVVVGPRFHARSELLQSLGVQTAELPMGMGEHVVAEADGRTSVQGVWAAGNVAIPMGQVINAAAQGQAAGLSIVADILEEANHVAIGEYRRTN